MSTITKKEMVERIFKEVIEKQEIQMEQKEVLAIVQELFNQIIHELSKGHRIEFREFGVFAVHETPSRIAQNPATLKKLVAPKSHGVRFKPGQRMKELIRASTPKEANIEK
ncbi:MAG: hypothetical protein COA79_16295 [Planctomycetota bacterium]|nr:MAG: hypothetical protein COA79_16295 [Planctomycetota bacterium]